MKHSPVVAQQTSVVMEHSPVVAGSGTDPDVATSSAVAEPQAADHMEYFKAESHVGSKADTGVMEAGDIESNEPGELSITFTEDDWMQDGTTLRVGDWTTRIAVTGRASFGIENFNFGSRKNGSPELHLSLIHI